ncbi:MAG: DUF72 domain-containing protein [Hyphomicrobiaceae bacterium]|nr:DUF72 domain-containing protein [Hyphomicrobiaceae bacterium]
MSATGTIRAGIGGWVFDPWRGTFFPDGLAKTKQLQYASRQLPTIEINGTFYRGQKPETFAKWTSETPDSFVFSLKGHRAISNRRELALAKESIGIFFTTGIENLGDRLGPILWQFRSTKQFDADDIDAFLKLLPRRAGGITLRHVLEVRHPSFVCPEFVRLAAKHKVAICNADHETYPAIADVTADFVYLRLQNGDESVATCYEPAALDSWAARAKIWADGKQPDGVPLADPSHTPDKAPRDVFVYFINKGKIHAPQAAIALMERVNTKL